jgi:hypothetical protein
LESPELTIKILCNTTYRFVCQWDERAGYGHFIDVHDKDSAFLTLDLKPGKKPEPKHLSGTLHVWEQTGIFRSMKACKVSNSWDFEEVAWQEGAREDETEEHGVSFLDVKDDNGHPFLMLLFNGGWSGCTQHFASFLGKRQEDRELREGLTKAEKIRLGMNLSWEDEDTEEEDAEESGKGESTEDSKEEAAVELSSEEEEEPARGTKRKAEDEAENSSSKRKIDVSKA